MTLLEFPKRETMPLALPYNCDIEQSLLGVLMTDLRALEKVSDFLKPEHFHLPAHQRIYSAIQMLCSQGKVADAATLKPIADADPDLVHLGGAAYLGDLVGSVVTVMNAEDYGRTIVDLYVRRELICVADETKALAANIDLEVSGAQLVEQAEAKLFELAEGGEQEDRLQSFPSVLIKVLENAEAAYRRDGRMIGATTGLSDLDKRLGGLVAPDLIILAGRPGMGKTALATGIAWRVAEAHQRTAGREGARVLFFSLEMSADQIGHRIASSEAGMNSEAVRKGEISHEEFQQFILSGKRLAGLPLYIDDRGASSLSYMRSKARRMKRQGGLGLIVVDYLQLIGSANRRRSDNRTNEVSEITQGLKALAKDLSVPILALSQLSRAVEQREDKRPQLSDLRESGSIEQDADEVMFVFREQYYVERDEPVRRSGEDDTKYNDRCAEWEARVATCRNLAEVIIGKNRHGPTGVVKLHFDGPTTTFSDLVQPTSYYDPGRGM
jgi:replicative DNA helicase